MKRAGFALVLIVIAPMLALAARFPDKVAKEFVIEGEAAIKVATALGMPTDRDNHLALPWKRDSSQCYKGIGEDGKAEYGSCDPNPAPINVIRFSTNGDAPRLEIFGIWLDGETGSTADVPKYTFSSPAMKSSEDLMGWTGIVAKLGEAIARSKEQNTKILDEDGPLIQIERIESGDDVQFIMGIDDRSPPARMLAAKQYEECLERLKESQTDSGC